MDEYLFISQDYLTSNSVINRNVDYEQLIPTIIMCQDTHIQEILGSPLFEELCEIGNAGTGFSTDQLVLIKKYIQKTLIWYVKTELPMDLKFKLMNKGVMVKSSENSQAAETSDIIKLMDVSRKTAETYAGLLKSYLENNVTKFPKYQEFTEIGMNHTHTTSTTGIYLEDYDDYEQEKCKQNFNGTSHY